MELLFKITYILFAFCVLEAIITGGAALLAAEKARKAAKQQAQAMEKSAEQSTEHLKREQQFLEELRRGFLDERARLLRRYGSLDAILDRYLKSVSTERGEVAKKLERLSRDPALVAGARLALADALGLNREVSRRMMDSLIGSGQVRGSGVARALTSEEVRRRQETERQLADLARQEALDAFQLQQQASQLRESIAREQFQMPLAIEEALANRALGMGSNIAQLAQVSANAQLQAQMQAQQMLAQQRALTAQQLASGIAGLAQAYQQQQMMNKYFDILRNSPMFGGTPPIAPTAPVSTSPMNNPVYSPLFNPSPVGFSLFGS